LPLRETWTRLKKKWTLSTRAGLSWKKRKFEFAQSASRSIDYAVESAKQKAMIVFPRRPVVFSTSSNKADSKSSGSGFISQAAISLSIAP
jgi:hypothetical protein